MNLTQNLSIGEIIECLPDIAIFHGRDSKIYKVFDNVARYAAHAFCFNKKSGPANFMGGFGDIRLPFIKMGAIDSRDLFGLDELIIFSFYWTNRDRYRAVADIGANIGLHSILMSRCGWRVMAFEPDPIHANLLRNNLDLNHITSVELIEAAVSDKPGKLEFIRVLGNTTGSHLAGAKHNPYGELQRFPVDVVSIQNIMCSADFVKMDVEGQEAIIILSTDLNHWTGTDMMVEIGTAENASVIFEHLSCLGVNAFAQKLGWERVVSVHEMPNSYKEGSLFITQKKQMPWTAEIRSDD